jgi:small-conductance mechanosensitive channel
MDEALTLYERLIQYINENVPLLGETYKLVGLEFTITDIALPIVFLFLLNLLGNGVRALLINRILGRYIDDRKTILSIGNTTKYTILAIGLGLLLTSIGLNEDSDLNKTLIKDKDHPLKVFDLIRVVFFMALLAYFSGKFKSVFVKQILSKYSDDIGVSQSIGTIIQYLLIIIGGLIIIQNSGINLGSLNVLAGALGVGIGFGLQNIANNFISGLIILFERPVKVGDRIDVGSVNGDVIKISSRATTINTNDNISIIIPNADVINKQVINWSHNDRNVRFGVPVGVSYKEDPAKIRKILLEVAEEHPGVLKKPAAEVLFIQYGDSSLDFDLKVWTSSYINRPVILKSELYYRIFEKFKEHNVEIPYPQRDLHIRSGLNPPKDASQSFSGN